MRNLEQRHYLVGLLLHGGRDVVIRPDADTAEEPRQYGFASGYVARAGLHQIVADNPQKRAQIEHVPALLSKDAQSGAVFRIAGITLARNGLDQRGFTRSVRTEDGDVLPG